MRNWGMPPSGSTSGSGPPFKESVDSPSSPPQGLAPCRKVVLSGFRTRLPHIIHDGNWGPNSKLGDAYLSALPSVRKMLSVVAIRGLSGIRTKRRKPIARK